MISPPKRDNDSVAIIIGIQNYKRLGKADFANKDAWGDNMKGIELTEPCVYVAEKNDETIRRLL